MVVRDADHVILCLDIGRCMLDQQCDSGVRVRFSNQHEHDRFHPAWLVLSDHKQKVPLTSSQGETVRIILLCCTWLSLDGVPFRK